MGKLSDVESYMRQTVETSRRALGEEHPDTLFCVSNLGAFLNDMHGPSKEAENYVREALDAQRRILGEEHLETLVSMGHFGGFLLVQRKFSEAEPYLREAVDAGRRDWDVTNPSMYLPIAQLGLLLAPSAQSQTIE